MFFMIPIFRIGWHVSRRVRWSRPVGLCPEEGCTLCALTVARLDDVIRADTDVIQELTLEVSVEAQVEAVANSEGSNQWTGGLSLCKANLDTLDVKGRSPIPLAALS